MKTKMLCLGLSLVTSFGLAACGKSEKSGKQEASVPVDKPVETGMDAPVVKPVETGMDAPVVKPTADATPMADMAPKVVAPTPLKEVTPGKAVLTVEDLQNAKPEENWKQVAELPPGAMASAFSLDGSLFAYQDSENREWVRVVDTSTWKTRKIYKMGCNRLQIDATNGKLACDNSPGIQYIGDSREPSGSLVDFRIIDLTTNKFLSKHKNEFTVVAVKKCEYADAAADWYCDGAITVPGLSARFDRVVGITAIDEKFALAMMPILADGVDIGTRGKYDILRLPMSKMTTYASTFTDKDKILMVESCVIA